MQINYLISQIPFLIVPELQNLIRVLDTTTYLVEQNISVHPYETGNNLKRFFGPAHCFSSLAWATREEAFGPLSVSFFPKKNYLQFYHMNYRKQSA